MSLAVFVLPGRLNVEEVWRSFMFTIGSDSNQVTLPIQPMSFSYTGPISSLKMLQPGSLP